ncbi:replicative DNA helicase [Lachnospiraceae bacterium oral taxon 500]|nr:replicative DNA helicase [Lachnospiraceae bacterium oral taxon 500]
MADEIKRIPPYSLEAEQTVIGSMLMSREAVYTATEYVSEDDFYTPEQRTAFAAIYTLFRENRSIDLITVQDQLNKMGKLEEVGGIEYLTNISLNVPTSAHVKEYARIVQEKSVLRRLIRSANDIAADSFEGKEKLEEILNKAEERIFNIIQNRRTSDLVLIKSLISPALDSIARAYGQHGAVTGLPSGFIDLDHMTAGFQPSDLILVAARPSMGKSSFVLNITQYAAVKEKKSVAFFSLEMSKEQLTSRMISAEAMIDAQKIRNGNLENTDFERLLNGASVLGEARIFIDDTPGISVADLRAKCRKLKLTHGLDLIIIDYLQLMTGSARSESRQQEISEISRSLKAIAREMQAPVIALSQLSRAVESRADHRPMLSDLRESGAIEQDADVVMFLFREEYYNATPENKGQAEVIIAKQRNGPTGSAKLLWLGEYTRFMNMERQY